MRSSISQPGRLAAPSTGLVPQWVTLRNLLLFVLLMMVWIVPNQNAADFRENPTAGQGGNVYNQIVWFSLLGLGLLLCRERWRYFRWQLDVPLFLLIGWCAFTVPFAIVPDTSMRRLIFTTAVILSVALAITNVKRTEDILQVLLVAIVIETVTKYVYVLAFPSIGLQGLDSFEPHLAGLWKGQYAHKNIAGATCAIELIILYAARRRAHPFYLVALAALEVFFLIKSGSKTPAIIVLGSILISEFLLRARSFALIFSVAVFVVIVINFFTIFTLIDADSAAGATAILGNADFTGRTDVWRLLIAYASSHLATGAGFQSFWQIGSDSPAAQESRAWVAHASYGHQGYLDMLAAVGLPGLIIILVFIVFRPSRDLFRIRRRADPVLGMYVSLWIFGLFHNGTESDLLNRADAVWIFFVMGLAGLKTFLAAEAIEPSLRQEGRSLGPERRRYERSPDARPRSIVK